MVPKLPIIEHSTPLWHLYLHGPLISVTGQKILIWWLSGGDHFWHWWANIYFYLFIYLIIFCTLFFCFCFLWFLFFWRIIFLFRFDFFIILIISLFLFHFYVLFWLEAMRHHGTGTVELSAKNFVTIQQILISTIYDTYQVWNSWIHVWNLVFISSLGFKKQ